MEIRMTALGTSDSVPGSSEGEHPAAFKSVDSVRTVAPAFFAQFVIETMA
jgi:hypothetical protein